MANDLNRCEFIGHLGADVEVRYMPSGGAVANFRIAVGKSWKDKQTGNKEERTTWVQIVAFNKLGEICGEYLKKGSRVFIAGELRIRKWQDMEGNDRYSTEVVAADLQFLDSKPPPSQEQATNPAPSQAPVQAPVQTPEQTPGEWLDDDDIPF